MIQVSFPQISSTSGLIQLSLIVQIRIPRSRFQLQHKQISFDCWEDLYDILRLCLTLLQQAGWGVTVLLSATQVKKPNYATLCLKKKTFLGIWVPWCPMITSWLHGLYHNFADLTRSVVMAISPAAGVLTSPASKLPRTRWSIKKKEKSLITCRYLSEILPFIHTALQKETSRA